MNDQDDTFLARWLAGELSPEELADFEKTEDFRRLQLLMQSMKAAEKPSFDKDAMLASIREKQRVQASTRRAISLWSYLAAAAAVALLVFWFWPSDNAKLDTQQYATAVGDQMSLTLADGSTMDLNAASTAIVAMAEDFSIREILLNGEAYFSVPRKGTFEVQTAMGRISVLGTRFSVRRRGQQLDVSCYEGSVRVSDGLQETTLKAGEQIRWTDNGPNPPEPIPAGEEKPSWSNGVSQLRNMSLEEIIGEYERQFAIQITADSGVNLQQILTVSFPHDDPLEALDIGLSAFGIEANSLKDGRIQLRSTR